MYWRLLLSPPMCGAENMALDEALLERARLVASARPRNEWEGVFRVYSWAHPTLSLGRHQKARGAYDPSLAARHGVAIVRRPTGGRALLHHREITYSVSAPIVPGESLRAAYDRINALLLASLHSLGVEARLAIPDSRPHPPDTAPCFELPSAGELVLGGRKLAGSAQYREGPAYLQHGSILVHDDQPLLAALSREPLGALPPAASLHDALGRAPSTEEFAEVAFEQLRRLWDPAATDWAPDDALLTRCAVGRARYADDAWTWRR